MSQTAPTWAAMSGAKVLPRGRATESWLARNNEATIEVVAERLEKAGVLHLANRVAREWCVPIGAVLGRRRTKRASAARRALWALLYGSLQPISYPELGYLVARDHTTVMNGLELREREVLEEIGGAT